MIYFLDNCSVGSAFILLTVTKEKLLELDQHEMNLNTQPVLRIRIRGICIFSLDPDADLYQKMAGSGICIKVHPGSGSGSVTNFLTAWIWIRIKMIRIRNTVHSRAVCVLL